MIKTKNKCQWCGGETNLPQTYHAMGPLQVKYELLLQGFEKKYGEKWYDKDKEIGKELIDDVAFYDQVVNTVSRGIVCADCLDKDDKVYTKFRKNDKGNNIK